MKPLYWVASAKKDLLMPETTKHDRDVIEARFKLAREHAEGTEI